MDIQRKRFLKLWAKHFLMAVGIALFGIVGLVTFVVGTVLLAKEYGPGIILAILAVTTLFIGLGGMTHSLTKDKLKRIEDEEERTMAALRKDHSIIEPQTDQFTKYLNAHIQQMRKQKTLFKNNNSSV